MESSSATLDTDWFRGRPGSVFGDDEGEDNGGGGGSDDENMNGDGVKNGGHDDRAQAVSDALACIQACSAWISRTSRLSEDSMPNCDEVAGNCAILWRANFKTWQVPCGNRLNVPDLLFVAASYLRVVAMPAASRQHVGSTNAVLQLEAYLTTALKEWNRSQSNLHTAIRTTIDSCARAIVFWGSNIAPTRMLDTTLTQEDVSMLTMNVNVHQSLDNRARNTDLIPTRQASATTDETIEEAHVAVDCEALMQRFVTLASRYAFFASLHKTALLPSVQPRLELHRRVASLSVRPEMNSINSNVTRMHALFLERSCVSMPEFVRREINNTIWKCMLSVGSMEVHS